MSSRANQQAQGARASLGYLAVQGGNFGGGQQGGYGGGGGGGNYGGGMGMGQQQYGGGGGGYEEVRLLLLWLGCLPMQLLIFRRERTTLHGHQLHRTAGELVAVAAARQPACLSRWLRVWGLGLVFGLAHLVEAGCTSALWWRSTSRLAGSPAQLPAEVTGTADTNLHKRLGAVDGPPRAEGGLLRGRMRTGDRQGALHPGDGASQAWVEAGPVEAVLGCAGLGCSVPEGRVPQQ